MKFSNDGCFFRGIVRHDGREFKFASSVRPHPITGGVRASASLMRPGSLRWSPYTAWSTERRMVMEAVLEAHKVYKAARAIPAVVDALTEARR